MALWRARLNSHGPTRAARRVEPVGLPPDGDEDLLDDLLGEPLRPGHLVGERVQRPAVAGVEGLDGALVALDDAGQQGGVLGASGRAVAVGSARARASPCGRSGPRRPGSRRGANHTHWSFRCRTCADSGKAATARSIPVLRSTGRARMAPSASGSIGRPMFATLLGALPRPPLPADAPPDGAARRGPGHPGRPRPGAADRGRLGRLVRRRRPAPSAWSRASSTGRWATDRPLEAVRLELARSGRRRLHLDRGPRGPGRPRRGHRRRGARRASPRRTRR